MDSSLENRDDFRYNTRPKSFLKPIPPEPITRQKCLITVAAVYTLNRIMHLCRERIFLSV